MLHQTINSATTQTVTFNDGQLVVLQIEKAKIIDSSRPFVFGFRTVGVTRYYQAKTAGTKVDAVVVVPLDLAYNDPKSGWLWDSFSFEDGVIHASQAITEGADIELVSYRDGRPKHYTVEQIQLKQDSKPPCMQISLKERTTLYGDERPIAQRLGRVRDSRS